MEKYKIKFALIILLIGSVLITGCAKKIQTAAIPRAPLSLPAIPSVKMNEVKWTVVTEANFHQVIEDMKAHGQKPVLFALTEDGIANINIDLAQLRAYIEQQKSIIVAYQKYYEDDSKNKNESGEKHAKKQK